MRALGEELERIRRGYNRVQFIHPDPVERVRPYRRPADREIAGLLAAGLAYGRVRQILNSLEGLLPRLSESPADFIDGATPTRINRAVQGFRHRWTTAEETAALLLGVRRVRRRYGSLEACFASGLGTDHTDTVKALGFLVGELCRGQPRGNSLLAAPGAGSACKRLHLYLRWMVRRDEVDPGGWTRVSPALLLVPLDTHMFRVGTGLGFTRRARPDLAAAREITCGFRKLAPEDPVRYDFALTRPGIRDGVDFQALPGSPVDRLRALRRGRLTVGQ